MHNLMNFHDHFTYDKILKFPNLWNAAISNMAAKTWLPVHLKLSETTWRSLLKKKEIFKLNQFHEILQIMYNSSVWLS